MALVIVSAGPLTDSRLRTIGARGLALSMAAVALLAMTLCFALGYQIARGSGAPTAGATGPATLDLSRPEGRALIDRIGTLSGRLSRLESEAVALGRRLGDRAASAPRESVAEGPPAGADTVVADTEVSAQPRQPSGGPLVPLTDLAAIGSQAGQPAYDYHTGLSQLEAKLSRIEAELAEFDEMSAERQLANMAYPNRLPVLGQTFDIGSAFGVRRDPFTGRLARHTGLDIPAPRGTAILASGGGRVRIAGYYGAYGHTVVIDHGDGLSTLYGHASKLFVRKGDVVMPGQKIAAVGSSGRSTGPHLHFEVIRKGVRVEPTNYLAQVLPGGDLR